MVIIPQLSFANTEIAEAISESWKPINTFSLFKLWPRLRKISLIIGEGIFSLPESKLFMFILVGYF